MKKDEQLDPSNWWEAGVNGFFMKKQGEGDR